MTSGKPNAGAVFDIAAREAQILGAEPRIAPMDLDGRSPVVQQYMQQMADLGAELGTRDSEIVQPILNTDGSLPSDEELAIKLANIPDLVRTMLRHPNLLARQTDYGVEMLLRGALPARLRELAVLRILWLCQAPYPWGEHVLVARNNVAMTGDDFERITIGPDAPRWTPIEAAVLRATDELHADAMITDATWATLAEHFDDRQLIELPMVVGHYQCLAYSQNTLRLRLHDGNDGLRAR